MKLDWGNIIFNSESEYYETLGFLSQDREILDLRTESNQKAGAWGEQIRFYWNEIVDIQSLPRPLKDAFALTTSDKQRRLSATAYIRNIRDNHSFSKCNEPDDSYTKHWHKTSLDDVVKTVPIQYHPDFYRGYNWNSEITNRINANAEVAWDNITSEKEGAQKGYYTTKYERSKANRDAAIKIHGCKCNICGFDFEVTYGELGKAFIEVHHIKPLATLDSEVTIDPNTDLICVCSNCHRMLHRFKDYMIAVDELKRIVNNNNK